MSVPGEGEHRMEGGRGADDRRGADERRSAEDRRVGDDRRVEPRLLSDNADELFRPRPLVERRWQPDRRLLGDRRAADGESEVARLRRASIGIGLQPLDEPDRPDTAPDASGTSRAPGVGAAPAWPSGGAERVAASPGGEASGKAVDSPASSRRGRRVSLSPARRAWLRFRSNRRGYVSLWLFILLFGASLFAELLSNDRPIVASYQGQTYWPLWNHYPETTFGGDFRTATDWHDPFIVQQFERDGNWALWPLNRYSYDTINYFAASPNPAPPSSENRLGTDDQGRDVLARLLYGFRLSVLFGLALTAIGVSLGIVAGAIQGYFGGRLDLAMQRLIEVWGSIPELYLLLILAAMFEPSVWILLAILSLFGWMGLSDYVRAEFLRNRQLEYVTAARALGLRDRTIITRHVLPNSLTPVIAFLPFRMSAAIVALTSLDFLGLGVPPTTPSLGELLSQGKANLDAWWISLPTFAVLVGMLMLLIFVGEALRDAFDPRRG